MPQASSLAAAIKKQFSVEPEVRPGEVGAFDVIVDGELIFSKFESHRFPEHHEILSVLEKR